MFGRSNNAIPLNSLVFSAKYDALMTHPLFSIPEQIIRTYMLDWLLENTTIRLLDKYGRIFGEAPPPGTICTIELQRTVHPSVAADAPRHGLILLDAGFTEIEPQVQ